VHASGSDSTNPASTSGARVMSWTEPPTVPWSGHTGAHTLYVVEEKNPPASTRLRPSARTTPRPAPGGSCSATSPPH
jgi:hypothetical protein